MNFVPFSSFSKLPPKTRLIASLLFLCAIELTFVFKVFSYKNKFTRANNEVAVLQAEIGGRQTHIHTPKDVTYEYAVQETRESLSYMIAFFGAAVLGFICICCVAMAALAAYKVAYYTKKLAAS